MNHSAAPSKTVSPKTSSVTYLYMKDRTAEQAPIRYPWTEELERRRRAVARWRGNEAGLKEQMMRE
ncbi:hypothetical protein [Hyphomicrobium sp. CS1GBMeth3]|uniref:hypothetical protein n=1 Tax=Hyphomicrobium sp. CS1GBMeth3 TaxID=1892845 RepID=UPI000A6FAAF5|nr:hypothetical protein [Hyphomicrobium sp. CS1GBMeth3]